jgi:hypothetical protein
MRGVLRDFFARHRERNRAAQSGLTRFFSPALAESSRLAFSGVTGYEQAISAIRH